MKFRSRTALACLVASAVAGAAEVSLPTPSLAQEAATTQEGMAHYYAKRFHGRKTASGIPLDNNAMVAAHKTWPFGTIVRVTAVNTGKSVEVKVIDRIGRSPTVIDLSRAAASELGFLATGEGQIPVKLDVVKWGKE
ncbi:MAG: septal ring lytic transglycosylase RlpA family protein [Rhodospirillales bacterium]|nr:septal ring lytic transglycosylase RlpA family protein [Rhodospirillales bacterium]